MKILVVGNVLKDVYLNLDGRTEAFETDKAGVKWLDFEFNGSCHRFFSRHSSYGGAAVTLLVLSKMGVEAEIAGSSLGFDGEEIREPSIVDSYRYILNSDDGISYLTETMPKSAKFVAPEEPVEMIFVDRSAKIDGRTAKKIVDYLDEHRETVLAIYVGKANSFEFNSLARRADLVFYEEHGNDLLIKTMGDKKLVMLSPKAFYYRDLVEPVTVERIDRLTHLSAYSVAAATILGGLVLGKTMEESLKLARANLENATVDEVLDLKEMEIIAATEPQSLELITATLLGPGKKIYMGRGLDVWSEIDKVSDKASGIVLTEPLMFERAKNGVAMPDYLISKRIIPGVVTDNNAKRLREFYEMGVRTAMKRDTILSAADNEIMDKCRGLASFAKTCQSAGIVPILEIDVAIRAEKSNTKTAEVMQKILKEFFAILRSFGVNFNAVIVRMTSGADYSAADSSGLVPLSEGTSAASVAGAVASASRFSASAAGS